MDEHDVSTELTAPGDIGYTISNGGASSRPLIVARPGLTTLNLDWRLRLDDHDTVERQPLARLEEGRDPSVVSGGRSITDELEGVDLLDQVGLECVPSRFRTLEW